MTPVSALRAGAALALEALDAERAPAPTAPLAPLAWAERYATIILPTEGRQPFKPYSYQQALLADQSPRRLVLKARQTGLSNAIAIEALYGAVSVPDQTILFVSRSQDAARVLIRYIQHALVGCTALMPALVNENQSELAWANGSRVISLPANPSTGRSLAASRVYLDEFAFCQYDQLVYESIIGTVSTGGDLTILSTPNGRGNMFFRLWAGLEGGTWSRHHVHWWDCPRYDAAWAEQTKASMPRQSWAQEYETDFVASGDAVFDAVDLARCADGYVSEPDGCDRYVTAWDIGRRTDHTVGGTWGLRGETWHLLTYERVLEPYPAIQARIEARARRFPGQHWVESNGVGDPVIENLTVRVLPFTTTAKTKVQAVQALQLLIQQGRLKHQEPQLGRELSLYQWRDEHLQTDSVIASAIAAHAILHPVQRWGAV